MSDINCNLLVIHSFVGFILKMLTFLILFYVSSPNSIFFKTNFQIIPSMFVIAELL